MKTCLECRKCKPTATGLECRRPRFRKMPVSPVTGMAEEEISRDCYAERMWPGFMAKLTFTCGREGRFWEAKA